MARRLSWSDVRGGIVAAVALAAIVFVTLKYSRLGMLHGDTFALYAHVGEARGLLVGSEVWLSGQKIGKITSIDFRSPSAADTSARIRISMEILEQYRASMHRDAIAQIRPGGSFIGAPVVYITPGTLGAAALQRGDTVTTHPQPDVEGATGQLGIAAKDLPIIINNVKTLTSQLASPGGTAGAFLNSSAGPGLSQLARTGAEFAKMSATLQGGGTVGYALRGGLMQRAGRVMSRADSVRALIASPNTSFGRFRKDSTLLAEVGDIRNEMTLIRAQLDGSVGTAGRVLHDSAISDALGEVQRQMTLLFADMKKHPLRYIRL